MQVTVGTQAGAEKALAGDFQTLGSGCYREAYLGDDGVVYKVPFYDDDCNRLEAKTCKQYAGRYEMVDCSCDDDECPWSSPVSVYIPHASLYEVDLGEGTVGVLAMEYLPGDETEDRWDNDYDCYHYPAALEVMASGDCHSENCLRLADGTLVLIDLGGC